MSNIVNEHFNEEAGDPFKLLNEMKDSIELDCIELNYDYNQHIKDCQ